MYAVIRTGGKQYRVAPGDVLKIESVSADQQTVEFADVLAFSGDNGIAKPSSAKVRAAARKSSSSTTSGRSSTRSCRGTARISPRSASSPSRPMA